MIKQIAKVRDALKNDPQNIELLRTIFATLLIGGIPKEYKDTILKDKIDAYKQAKSHFKANFLDDIFIKEFEIFFQILLKNEYTAYTVEELKRVLVQNTTVLMKSDYIQEIKQLNKEFGETLNDDEFMQQIVIPHIVDKYVELSTQVVELHEYMTACARYVEVFKRVYLKVTAEDMSAILDDQGIEAELNGRKKVLSTAEDCMEYYVYRSKVIQNMEAERGVKSFAYDGTYLLDAKNRSKGEAILDYGIDELDKVKNMMRRGNMICVMGPPKGGKTTFTTYLAERALNAGLNVAIWPLEGTPEEWIALITASAIATGHICEDDSTQISKSAILYDKYDTDDIRQKVASAQEVIASGTGRGKLSFLTGVAYIEDFEDELTTHYENVNRFDVIIMDSPINMQARAKMSKSEYLSKGFMNLKSYVANKMKQPALCLVTAQYKQDVIDVIRKNPNAEIDVTSGGETAESIRTPDDVIGLFSTATERENLQMRVHDIASRSNGHFEPFYMGCALGCAKFYDRPDLNN